MNKCNFFIIKMKDMKIIISTSEYRLGHKKV